jgi:DNA-binding MarR family transcriptional regulator
MQSQLDPVDGLAQLSFLVLSTLERRAAEHGLSLIQTRLLGVFRDRQPTMNELAAALGLDKSSATGLVARAERRGLVVRAPSSSDRSAVLVSLTDAGRSLAQVVGRNFGADVCVGGCWRRSAQLIETACRAWSTESWPPTRPNAASTSFLDRETRRASLAGFVGARWHAGRNSVGTDRGEETCASCTRRTGSWA